ncbi:Rha family transcriptional regulator [Bacillus velezensis]
MIKERFVTNSKVIAEKFGKRHSDVLRDIAGILKRNPELVNDFHKSFYMSIQNRKLPIHKITIMGEKRLTARYEYGQRSPRLERSFGEWMEKFFGNSYSIEKQKKIGSYRLDFFFPEIYLIVEYDEKEHVYKTVADRSRESYINKYFHKRGITPSWIRVKEDEEIEGIKEILLAINKITNGNVLTYIS